MMLPQLSFPNYNLELPLSKIKIEFRPYLVKEDKILLMAAQGLEENQAIRNVAQATKTVINNCVLTPDFDVTNIPSLDADFLFMNMRGKSVGEKTDIEITCNNPNDTEGGTCQNVFDVPININEIKVEGEVKSENITISNDVGIKMKPTSFKATLDHDPNDNEIERNIKILYNSIEQIYDKENVYTSKDFTLKDFTEWVDNLDNKSFQKMKDFIDNLPVLVIEKDATCNKCSHVHKLRFENTDVLSFF